MSRLFTRFVIETHRRRKWDGTLWTCYGVRYFDESELRPRRYYMYRNENFEVLRRYVWMRLQGIKHEEVCRRLRKEFPF
jgi:hypothetical protein